MKHIVHKQGKEYYAATLHTSVGRVRGFGKDPKEALARLKQLAKR